jgi:dihydrodipicolinate synthase/N-acetylneuraminate lyase
MEMTSRRAFLLALSGAATLRPASPKPVRGVFVILATPFNASKALDYEDLARQVEWQNRCGAHGIVWPQRASEFETLTFEERVRGFEVIAKAARGGSAAVVFGVQGSTTEEALKYIARAEPLSPDVLIAIPPNKARSLDDYRAYYRTLAGATKRPMFIQTAGGAPHLEMPVSMVMELAREHPHLAYVKEENEPVLARLRQLHAARPPMKGVFSGGAGKGMILEMSLGMDGTMPGAGYTDVYVQIWDAWQAGQRDRAREIFSLLMPLINIDLLVGQGYQYMMHRRGVFRTSVSRRDRPVVTKEITAEIDAAFARLKPYLRT